jgi:hypothetical protein
VNGGLVALIALVVLVDAGVILWAIGNWRRRPPPW